MRLHVDKEADALYLRLDDAKIIESEEVAPGVIVDFDAKNRAVGVEVLHLSRRAPKAKPGKYPPARVAALALHDKPSKKYGA
jgi:uncharacterized protein YuzE